MTKFTPDNICDIKNQDVGRSLSSKAQTHPDTIMISFQRHFNDCQWPLEYLYKKENSETAIPFPYFTRLAHLSGREVKTLFSLSVGREFKPNPWHNGLFVNGFGNLYTGSPLCLGLGLNLRPSDNEKSVLTSRPERYANLVKSGNGIAVTTEFNYVGLDKIV